MMNMRNRRYFKSHSFRIRSRYLRRRYFGRRKPFNYSVLSWSLFFVVLIFFMRQIQAFFRSLFSFVGGPDKEGQEDEQANESYEDTYQQTEGLLNCSMSETDHEAFADNLFHAMDGCSIYYISTHPVVSLLARLVELTDQGYDDLKAIYYKYGKRQLTCFWMDAFEGTLRGCVHYELNSTINTSNWSSAGKTYNAFMAILDDQNLN
jgi:hypothetical protein